MQQVIETGLKSTEQSEVAKMARVKKKERQQLLVEKVKEKPFLTDEELAKALSVSVQTIRLDRLELGIPELRGRIRKMEGLAPAQLAKSYETEGRCLNAAKRQKDTFDLFSRLIEDADFTSKADMGAFFTMQSAASMLLR